MKKLLAVAALVLLCGGCSTPSSLVQLKPNTSLQRLGICLKRGEHSFVPVAYQFEQTLDDFILQYNASPKRKFELYKSAPGDSLSLTIELVATRLVDSRQQTAGVIVSVIGFSLPFIMISAGAEFVIFFWYFPEARSMTNFSLSPDLADPGQAVRSHLVSSTGFLTSPEKQVIGQGKSFNRALLKVIGQLEKQLSSKRR